VEEGGLSRTLAFDCGHGCVQEERDMKKRGEPYLRDQAMFYINFISPKWQHDTRRY